MTMTELKHVFQAVRVIALIGYSANPDRPSQRVAQFLKSVGYRVIPINPGLAGQMALGEVVQPDLASIPPDIRVDMVDVFRTPDAVPDIVEDMLTHRPEARFLWLQLGVTHPQAEARAREAGLYVVADRCPAIEYPRLMVDG